MKIGVYIPTASFFVGGGEIVPLMQARYLSKRGHDVRIAVLDVLEKTSYFQTFLSENRQIPIDYLKPRLLPGDLSYESRKVDHRLGHDLYLDLGRELSDYCHQQKFDVLITHYAPAAIAVPESTKQILVLHGVPDRYEIVNQVATRIADKLVAVSQSVANGWEELHNTSSIEVVYNGVDNNIFRKRRVPQDIDVLYVGRLIEIKGVQFLIRAIANLVKRNLCVRAIIGGMGPYEASLKKLSKDFSLDDNLKFVGYIPDKDLPLFYNRSKIVVLPSFAQEGVLTTLLEASACGCAVITANCCGMKELIKERETGLLVKPKSSQDIAAKIKYLLENSKIREILGQKAADEINLNWTWEKSIDRFEKVINEVKN